MSLQEWRTREVTVSDAPPVCAAGAPRAAIMYDGSIRTEDRNTCYFTPEAAALAPGLPQAYGAVSCAPPDVQNSSRPRRQFINSRRFIDKRGRSKALSGGLYFRVGSIVGRRDACTRFSMTIISRRCGRFDVICRRLRALALSERKGQIAIFASIVS